MNHGNVCWDPLLSLYLVGGGKYIICLEDQEQD